MLRQQSKAMQQVSVGGADVDSGTAQHELDKETIALQTSTGTSSRSRVSPSRFQVDPDGDVSCRRDPLVLLNGKQMLERLVQILNVQITLLRSMHMNSLGTVRTERFCWRNWHKMGSN